jgi:integrase
LPNGKWKRISTKRNNVEDASKVACEKYDEVRFLSSKNLPIESKQFKDVAKLAIKEMQSELDAGYGKKTFYHYIGAIDRYLIPFFGTTYISNIDFKKMKEFTQWRTQKMSREPKASTLNNHNAALRRVFDVALNHGWIKEYQLPELRNKGLKTERRPNFTSDEYIELYKFMRSWVKDVDGKKEVTKQIREMMRDYVLVLANTGMRHGTETANLRWKNIEEFKGNDGVMYLRFWVNGKTGSRELIARHNVRRYLRRIQSRFDDLKDLSTKDLYKRDELVFRLRNGDVPKDLHGAFEQLMIDSGLHLDRHGKKRTLYSLRHTYATMRLASGVEIHTLARQMGTSVAMIESHYSHFIPTLAAEKLAGKAINGENVRQKV